MIQNQLSRFTTEDVDEAFNESLKKALLIRIQKNFQTKKFLQKNTMIIHQIQKAILNQIN